MVEVELNELLEGPENPGPDSRCTECEELVNSVGEWNDETAAFAGVTILWRELYGRVKEMNAVRRGNGGRYGVDAF